MRIPNHSGDRDLGDSTMTPMIDVVFLLLVFFVATSSFRAVEFVLPSSLVIQEQGAAQVVLPEPLEDLEQVVLKIEWLADRPAWSVNGTSYDSLAEVRAVLSGIAEFDPQVPVILDVAGPVPIGEVIHVYDASRLAGLKQIQFAAKG